MRFPILSLQRNWKARPRIGQSPKLNRVEVEILDGLDILQQKVDAAYVRATIACNIVILVVSFIFFIHLSEIYHFLQQLMTKWIER